MLKIGGKKLRIVTDSGCDIKREMVENDTCGFDKVPLSLHFEDRVYVDDHRLDMDEFLSHMENSPTTVKSASPSPASFIEKFLEGESVFVVTLSSKISATYQNAMMAKKITAIPPATNAVFSAKLIGVSGVKSAAVASKQGSDARIGVIVSVRNC